MVSSNFRMLSMLKDALTIHCIIFCMKYNRFVCRPFLKLQYGYADDSFPRSPGRGSSPAIFTLGLSGECLVFICQSWPCITESTVFAEYNIQVLMVYWVITRSLHIQLQVASELSSTFSWCMVMHPFVNLVCHWEHLRTWIFYLDVVGSDIDSNMIFVGRTMQVVRAYKNAEHAEVQFTVSSWDFLNSITSRWISLNCFVNWVLLF